MPSPLQQAPLGLLGLFGLKTLGKNPDLFGSEVVPVAEVSDLYGLQYLGYVGLTSAAIQNWGDTVTLVVPDGIVWRVHAAAVTLASGNPITSPDGMACSMQCGGPNIFCSLTFAESPLTAPTGASVSLVATYTPSRPLVLPPGTFLNGTNLRAFSAPVEMHVRALVEAIPV